MGFWGTLGKIGLKIAPYAAMAIPGVGVPLGMALQGGLGAANAAASGGGWKGALLGGALGAATSGIGSKMAGIGPSGGVLRGVGSGGPNTGYINKAVSDVANRATGAGGGGMTKFLSGLGGGGGGGGWQGALGGAARGAIGGMGGQRNMPGAGRVPWMQPTFPQNQGGYGQGGMTTPPFNPNAGYPQNIPGGMGGGIGGNMQGDRMQQMIAQMMGGGGGDRAQFHGGAGMTGGPSMQANQGPMNTAPQFKDFGGQGGIGPQMAMMQQFMDQRAPNLAYSIGAGRNQAIANQPWRTQPNPVQEPYNIMPNQQMPPHRLSPFEYEAMGQQQQPEMY